MANPNFQQYPMPFMAYPYPQMMQTQPQPQVSQNTQPLQNAGFIMVSSEDEAYRYPVALGKCMTFKVENEPIVIEKSMSYSQLENPKIDRYRLVREDVVDAPKTIEEVVEDKSMSDDLKDELQAIRREIEGIKKKLYTPNQKPIAKKREENENE